MVNSWRQAEERGRLEAALQEAAFLRGRLATAEVAPPLLLPPPQHQQQQQRLSTSRQVEGSLQAGPSQSFEAAAGSARETAAALRAALAAEQRLASDLTADVHELEVANQARNSLFRLSAREVCLPALKNFTRCGWP